MAALVWAPIGECKTYEKIGTTTTSIGFTSAKIEYKGKIAKAALLSVETAAARIMMTGDAAVITATSGGTGHFVDVGQSIILEGTETIRNFRCINAVASSGCVVFASFFF
jgi:hypothetical protein